MADYPTSATPIKTIGGREFCTVNGREFTRRKGTQQWIETEPTESRPPPAEPGPLYLSLVHQRQGEGEPLHWSLYVARDDWGWVYQVKGDAENMRYQPSTHLINIVSSESFLTLYQLAAVTEQQAMVVKQVAESEPPPRAPNRRAVTENCQGWTVRVIAKAEIDSNGLSLSAGSYWEYETEDKRQEGGQPPLEELHGCVVDVPVLRL